MLFGLLLYVVPILQIWFIMIDIAIVVLVFIRLSIVDISFIVILFLVLLCIEFQRCENTP